MSRYRETLLSVGENTLSDGETRPCVEVITRHVGQTTRCVGQRELFSHSELALSETSVAHPTNRLNQVNCVPLSRNSAECRRKYS